MAQRPHHQPEQERGNRKRHHHHQGQVDEHPQLGVCEPLRERLLAQGYAVRIYVPCGRDWYGYSARRNRRVSV